MQSKPNTTRTQGKIDFKAVQANKLAMFRRFMVAKDNAEKNGAVILKSL